MISAPPSWTWNRAGDFKNFPAEGKIVNKTNLPNSIFPSRHLPTQNTTTRCEISSKLTIKTPKRRHWRRSDVFIVDFEHISHLVLLFLLLTLNMQMPTGLGLIQLFTSIHKFSYFLKSKTRIFLNIHFLSKRQSHKTFSYNLLLTSRWECSEYIVVMFLSCLPLEYF